MPDKTNADEERNILDTISYSQQTEALRTFDPRASVLEFLEKLPQRERQVITSRYGLENGEADTLEVIGHKLGLTRERIRQIEKDATAKLRTMAGSVPANLGRGMDLIFQIIENHGHIMREERILNSILAEQDSPIARQNLLFILNISPQFISLPESTQHHRSWSLAGFDQDLLQKLAGAAAEILTSAGGPLSADTLLKKIKDKLPQSEIDNLTNDGLESHLGVSKILGKNPYGDWGLIAWTQINPKDVGDKAFLILSHHKKPEHYSKITDMINKQGFDKRLAHKESVHNELIKDKRFVLVGRGIYALSEWGYSKGVVADIIAQVLTVAARPLSKEEIIGEVLKQRLVKRNTIIVGLSNKNKFKKTENNKYLNVQ